VDAAILHDPHKSFDCSGTHELNDVSEQLALYSEKALV